MQSKLMTHMIAGYPDRETSLAVARAFIEGGSSFLEIQFPFSDGTADGPFIQEACDKALKAGFSVNMGFKLVSEIAALSDVPVFIMTYANIIFAAGVKDFLSRCKESGASGIIIPDLPPDSDEKLYAEGKALGLHVVPVIAPSITDTRLKEVFNQCGEYIYASLRKGITGQYTEIGEENLEFLKKAAGLGAKVLAGFGISTAEQVATLAPHVHASIIGTAFIKEIKKCIDNGKKDDIYIILYNKIKALLKA
ncbi:MAG: tryptophan synthase subunit alpha [Spirochaetales bacterium]|nr:tryptophan synthase subunit alpha [Spirochaetales bacterium]